MIREKISTIRATCQSLKCMHTYCEAFIPGVEGHGRRRPRGGPRVDDGDDARPPRARWVRVFFSVRLLATLARDGRRARGRGPLIVIIVIVTSSSSSSSTPLSCARARRRRSYLGDGGTEEGVGGSLDDHRHGAARETHRRRVVSHASSFIQSLDKPARARGSVIIIVHPSAPTRDATDPSRDVHDETATIYFLYHFTPVHRSIGSIGRRRARHPSFINPIHRGRGVRHPQSINQSFVRSTTYVLPKSRAPSSPPLELRRTMETPRLAVVLTETTEVVFAETDILWASMVNTTTCVRVRRTTGDARVGCVSVCLCVYVDTMALEVV